MINLTYNNDTLTFNGNNYVVEGSEKTGDNTFIIHCQEGSFCFENSETTINGNEIINIYSLVPKKTGIATPNWLGLEQALFYSGLREKAKASANLDQFEFASLIGAFANGKQGLTSENTLYYLLNAINADWDENDIAQLNGYLQQFNFTITLI